MAEVVRVLAEGPRGSLWREGKYYRVRWATDTPWALLARVSGALSTEVVAVSEQTTSSVFEYRRYRDGREERGIAYVDDRWIEVRGEPDSWEASVLFTAAALERLREELAASPDDEVEATTQFEAKTLVVGRSWPTPPHSVSVEVPPMSRAEAVDAGE